jgi:hypothetical protein
MWYCAVSQALGALFFEKSGIQTDRMNGMNRNKTVDESTLCQARPQKNAIDHMERGKISIFCDLCDLSRPIGLWLRPAALSPSSPSVQSGSIRKAGMQKWHFLEFLSSKSRPGSQASRLWLPRNRRSKSDQIRVNQTI